MAKYSKRRFKKRGGGSSFLSKAGKVANIAWKGYHIAKFIAGIVNAEKNYLDTDISGNYNSTATITDLTSMAEGDDQGQRQGRSLLAKSLFLRGYINMSSSASATSVRCMVVMDTMNQGDAPTYTDIVQANAVASPLNVSAYPGRYKILYDRQFLLSINGTRMVPIRCFKKLNNHIRFEGTGANTSTRNSLYFVCVSSEATNSPAISGYARLAYYDN